MSKHLEVFLILNYKDDSSSQVDGESKWILIGFHFYHQYHQCFLGVFCRIFAVVLRRRNEVDLRRRNEVDFSRKLELKNTICDGYPTSISSRISPQLISVV